MIYLDISIALDRAIDLALKDKIDGKELISFLKNHPGRMNVIRKLGREIDTYEHKFKNRVSAKGKADMVVAVAHMFIKQAKMGRDWENRSDINKKIDKHRADRKQDIENDVKEVLIDRNMVSDKPGIV